jgi:ClpP class serine protease
MLGGVSASLSTVGLVKALENLKIKYTHLSTAETRINPFEKVKPEDEKWVQDILKFQDEALKGLISRVRKQALVRNTQNNEEITAGGVVLGSKGKDYGLVDSLEEFHSVVKKEYPDAKVVEMKVKVPKHGGKQIWREQLVHGVITEEMLEMVESTSFETGIQLKADISP